MGSENMMAGGKGMAPRKAMAGGADSGNFGVKDYPGAKGKASPHMGMDTGTTMADATRGVGMPIANKGMAHGMQAAPDHGPLHDHFDRGGKI